MGFLEEMDLKELEELGIVDKNRERNTNFEDLDKAYEIIEGSKKDAALTTEEEMETGTIGKFNERLDYITKTLEEARELMNLNTVDSLLRFFQTGIVEGIHLPTFIMGDDKEAKRLLASKLEDIVVNELGFGWNKTKLYREGELVLEHSKNGYTITFATIDPLKRSLVFHFDFGEMERERDVLLHKVKHKVKETVQRYNDTKEYLDSHKGIKRMTNKKTIEMLESNIGKMGSEIDRLSEEIKEINEHRTLLDDIKEQIPNMEYHLRKYGISFEYVKGEIYEV